MVRALLTAKEIDVDDYFGVLHLAAVNNHEGVVKVLLTTEKIDVAAKDYSGKTLLHWAVEKGYKEIVETLLSRGAGVNAVDNDENTPLHLAAEKGHEEVVKVLLDKGANVNATNKDENTPFDLAKIEEIKTLLKNAKKSDDGESLADNAADHEEDTGEEKEEGDVQPESQGEQVISAEEVTGLNTEGVGSVASAQTEEQPSSFFGSLFSILTNPFSLIASFFSGFFLWLFSSNGENADEFTSQSDVSLLTSNLLDGDSYYTTNTDF